MTLLLPSLDLKRPMQNEPATYQIGRRHLLTGASALGLGALARAGDSALPQPTSADLDGLTQEQLDSLVAGSCQATPTATQGPFFIDLDLLRKDITEGEAGLPLTVVLRLVSASTCDPLEDVVVDLWSCESQGAYSGFASEGTAGLSFLRGYQVTDRHGMVRFRTIYPGWYPGRTPHLHVKAYPTPGVEYATQTFFEDDLTDRVYQLPPYDMHGPSPTNNTNDNFFHAENVMQFLGTPDLGNGLFAGITIVIP